MPTPAHSCARVRPPAGGSGARGGLAAPRWRAGVLLAGWLLAVTGCSAPSVTPEAAEWRTPRIGLCEDYPEETRTLAAARSDLQLARDAGATVLRVAFGWDAMEPEPGRYDWSFWDEFVQEADALGVQLIPYVCYTPAWAAAEPGEDSWRSPPRDPQAFGRFMEAIVRRYRGSIRSWELWNEPDNPAYWSGSAAELAELVRAGAAGVRAADPSAQVVLGGIATELGFLEELFQVHELAPFVDVVNLHAYFETWHPDPIESLPDYLEQAAEIVAEHGEAEPLWLAETGYSSVGPRRLVSSVYFPRFQHEHTAEAQAGALARTLLLALGTGWPEVVAWYRINDLPPRMDVIGDDNNRRLGVRGVSGEPKPALAAFHQLAPLLADGYRVVEVPFAVEPATPDDEAEVRVFELRDGRRLVAAWLRAPGSAEEPGELIADERAARVRVSLPGGWTAQSSVVRAAAAGAPPNAMEIAWRAEGDAGQLEFQLRGDRVVWCVLRP